MDLLWNVITPILGVAVSTIQVIPPLNAVLLCRKARSLGALNATPWAIGFVNCFGHVVYGAMLQDVFIMSSVGPGVMIHYFAVTSATALLGAQGKFDTVGRLENIVLFGLTLYVVLAFLIGTTLSRTKEDYDVALLVVGSVNSLNTMVFYCAPFSKVKKVLRTKDAASLYLPALLVNLLCASLWMCYGIFAINNFNIYIPNIFGITVTSLQLMLKIMYPSHAKSDEVDPIELLSLHDSAIAQAAVEGLEIISEIVRSRANTIRSRAGTLGTDAGHGLGMSFWGSADDRQMSEYQVLYEDVLKSETGRQDVETGSQERGSRSQEREEKSGIDDENRDHFEMQPFPPSRSIDRNLNNMTHTLTNHTTHDRYYDRNDRNITQIDSFPTPEIRSPGIRCRATSDGMSGSASGSQEAVRPRAATLAAYMF